MRKASFGKKMVSLTLAGSLSLSLLGTANGAAGGAGPVADIGGHWAEQEIRQWIAQGLIGGYEDGNFRPDKAVTRAEFVALVNRAFGFARTGGAAFGDLEAGDWSYADFQKAAAAGYIAGYGDGTVHPNAPVTRQEIAVIAQRLLGLTPSAASAQAFADAASIPPWSKGAVGAVEDAGIMRGYEDHAFRPANHATRAEAVVILSHALKVKAAPIAFDKAGTYGPETGTQTIKGDVVIAAPGVTLRNTVIEGSLTFAPGIGEGDAALRQVTVKGTTLVQGGGAHSIHFEDSVLLTVVVDKAAGLVRIVAEGTTTVASAVMQSGATLEESDLTGEGFTDVQLSRLLPKGTTVTLLGSFDDVDVSGIQVRIDIPSGSVEQITVTDEATGNAIALGSGAKIVDLVLNAAVKVTGGGTIETATMSKEAQQSSSFEKQPNKLLDETGAVIHPPPPPPSGPSQEQIDRAAADRVTALIAALPATADLTLAGDEAGVKAAETAFAALSASQKALVKTADRTKLSDAVARIAELKADKAAADAVVALIDALPDAAAVQLEDEPAVTAAKSAFDALTAAQQALVANADELAAALARIDARKADADAVAALIAALPEPAAATLADRGAVADANAKFAALSAAQQARVANKDKLAQAVAKIDTLIAAASDVVLLIDALPSASAVTLADQATVDAAKSAYDALSASQQALVTNHAKLADALSKIDALIAAANDVVALIDALPSNAAITLDDQASVAAAKSAYDALSSSQQALVTNHAKLTDALAKIDALIAAASDVVALIDALSSASAVTLADQAAVDAAKSAYDALSSSQQVLVTNHAKLADALAKIDALIAAADDVVALIYALPSNAAITLDDQASVAAAKTAFDALSASQQALVTNHAKLTDALAKIDALFAAASDVVALIDALPSASAVTLADQATVDAAKSAYDALSSSQQALVTNHAKLADALAKIDSLLAAANDVVALIDALPSNAAITLDDQASVAAAKTAYDALSASQQALVTNHAKLTDALAKIDALIAEANDVVALIVALPDTAQLKLSDKPAVVAANTAFQALSVSQQALVTNQAKLTDALARIAALEDLQAADAVTALIAALPAVAQLKLSDETAVNAAADAFNSLTATRQALVTNRDALTAAADRIVELKADKAAADAVVAQIAALPAIAQLTRFDEAAVNAANDAYAALTSAQQALVSNYSQLTGAVARIGQLKAEHEADLRAAAAVIALIDALQAPDAITLADKTAVASARAAYDGLTSARQVLVTNEAKLTAAEARIAELWFIGSKAVTSFDFSTAYATQARGESFQIADTNFGDHPVHFTISDGNVTIPVDLTWNIPLNGFTTGQAVGSAVDSFIQQYCNDHHIDLGQRTLAAMGFGDTFFVTTFATGSQASVTLGGGYDALFGSNHFSGTDEDTSKNRTFTVGDGAHTATIQLKRAYASIDAFVSDLNRQLQNATVAVQAIKLDAAHFKLSPTAANGSLAIDGADKAQFFDQFQLS
ncbi:S-layer homology domain-containing protein [Paenibacillus sp. MWE-103]|uniref:S-layer homology domain-containing protein n=1 Tax=Paenibacillus artemisiicola TaxID=1172618 RepID=A0ABS3WIL0_9BACL|nr:S-layer homology domain-containing protein [Paenibacillus artemisiicola]MBO7748158.1 S-layer homology domain-containing protein [Paenibacillus artemisiicola]